jgi:hypothetical protein
MINIVRYPCHTQALVPIVPIWNVESGEVFVHYTPLQHK